MKTTTIRLLLSVAVSLLGAGWALTLWAEDIDLFIANPGDSSDQRPTVLFMWDNASNNNANVPSVCSYDPSLRNVEGHGSLESLEPSLGSDKSAGMEQCSMVNALLAIRNSDSLRGKINIGLMVFNHNRFKNEPYGNNGNDRCGYLMLPPAQMDTAGLDTLISKITAFDNSVLTSNTNVGDTFAEAWSALNARSTSCSTRDYSSLASAILQCRDSTIVYIGNAFKNSNSTDGNQVDVGQLLKNELTNANTFGYATSSPEYELFTDPIAVTGVNTSGNETNKFWADEWSRFMKRVNVDDSALGDRNVTTYTVSVTDDSKQAQSTINYYAMIAKQGGGKTFKVAMNDPDALRDALLRIINEVQSINSVFASATLPVSANTQGTFLNQIYIAMFRPDGNAEPRWLGNVKQYRLGFDAGGNLVLTDAKASNDPVDSEGNRRVVESVTNPVTGTVAPDARSFWTTNTPGVTGWPAPSDGACPDAEGFWKNAPAGVGLACDAPDGDLVEKGGAAQMVRVGPVGGTNRLTATYADVDNENSRQLFTCNSVGNCPTGGSLLNSFSIDNTNLTSPASNPFGVKSETTGVSMLFGQRKSQEVTYSCLSGASTNRSCTLSYGGDPSFVVNNNLLLPEVSPPNCGYSAPCTVLEVPDSTTIKFTDGGNSDLASTTTTTTVGKASRVITATMPDHGLVAREQIRVSSCSIGNSSFTYNIASSDLPGAQGQLVTVSSVIDANTFTFSLGDQEWFSGASANISCTVTPELTPEKLVKWVRGEDNNAGLGAEDPLGPCPLQADGSRAADCPITIRPSIHGDVLHSRPAVINYPNESDGDVVVFYGSNDGVFHAINGNQTRSIGSVRPGGELWGFIAPEFFDKFQRMYKNSPLISHPGIEDPAITPQPKDYFFDGSTTILQDLRTNAPASTANKSFVYPTARRGGRLFYALDVTDKTTPKFLWSKSDADIPQLGQTWSQPRIAVLAGYTDADGVGKPVLIMGAGYDPAEDVDPSPGALSATFENSMGRGVIILDAVTGDLVWAALPDCTGFSSDVCVEEVGLTRSIAADVSLFETSGDGFVDRIYAADVGGNVWRMDVGSANVADWSIHKVAALGGTGNDARKFLFAPDAVIIPQKAYDLVIVISGDREHPLYTDSTEAGLAYNVNNRFYLLKDYGSAASPIVEADLVDLDQCVDADGNTVPCDDQNTESVTFNINDQNNSGYFFTFRQGEKGVNAPVTVAGKTFFATNQPDVPEEGSCTANLGIARAYEVDFRSGESISRLFSGGGLPPSPIAGLVTIGNDTIPFIIGGKGPSPFDPGEPEIDLSNKRNRAYWYYE